MNSQAAFGPPFFPRCRVADSRICLGSIVQIRESATRHRRWWIAAVVVAINGGCATEKAYEGPALPKSERAVVHADPALSAGLPVSLRLRRVDGRDVPLTASSVELPPGQHQLLVDCRVSESGATRRFTVTAELEPGGDYRLVATASARNCEAVTLQPR